MTASHRFYSLAISIAATFVLSACQPTAENNEAVTKQEPAMPSEVLSDTQAAPHVDDLPIPERLVEEDQMTDVLRDYTKSMTRMHDEMMVGMGYNDANTAFAKIMLGHHRGATEMAKIQLKYGDDEAIRQLAQDIIDAQKVEMDILNKWLASHPDAAKPKANTEAMQQAYARSMDVLNGDMVLGIADPIPDMAFVRGMLPHHISAVEMANIQLQYGTDEEMRQLAQDIIDTQQAQIELMQNWIAALAVINGEPDVDSSSDVSDSLQK